MGIAMQTIDHATLVRLVETGAIRSALVVGQAGGWGLIVKYGMMESHLAAQRSGKPRLFRKLETVTAYLQDIGVSRFEVDSSAYAPGEGKIYKRPDRAKALKRVHAAAAQQKLSAALSPPAAPPRQYPPPAGFP